MVVFEVYLKAGSNPDDLFSEETLKETGAQVMTMAQAKAVGFSGFQPQRTDAEPRLVACQPADGRFLHSRLEASGIVDGFRMHEVAT